jgi:hypothetical protein
MIYKLYKTVDKQSAAVVIKEDGTITSFLFDENNTDYQQYLAWCAEGNTPEPAEEQQ